ncbi:MAG: CHAD domain-containing protein [Microcoleaceae cyanobacterium]
MKTLQETKTLGDWAALGIQTHLRKVLKHEPEVLKDENPEELHQMRVGMRRLRSAMQGFAPVLNLPESLQDQRIGKVGRRLGKLRDLDVLLEALRDRYYPNLPPDEQEELNQAFLRLGKRRRKVFKLVQNMIADERYEQLKQELQQWLDVPCYTRIEQLPIREVLPDLLLPQISCLFLHPGWQVGVGELKPDVNPLENSLSTAELSSEAVEKILRTEGEILHDLRKEVKRVRYQMSLFTDFYGAEYMVYLEDMKAIQECLGEIQDSEVLESVMQEILKSNLDSVMSTFANLLTQNRHEAWQRWHLLQERYLNPETRQGFRVTVLHPALNAN